MRHPASNFEPPFSPHFDATVSSTPSRSWRPWGGGVGRDTFVEFAKRLVDSLNAFNIADGNDGYTDPTNPPTKYDNADTMPGNAAVKFAATTWGLSFYDGVVVFERLVRTHFKHIRAGNRTIPYA